MEQEAQASEAPVEAQVDATPEATPDRPEWLPEKFFQTRFEGVWCSNAIRYCITKKDSMSNYSKSRRVLA